jgi:aspartate carbamoyltransferase catalytic subunit
MKHVIRSQDISKQEIEKLFKEATKLEKKRGTPLRGKIMASLFYEPSTRTRFSFEAAMLRLGGSVITTENAREFSSAAKGETLEDSILVTNHYADVIVMRHYEMGAAERASKVSRIPIINAGDGPGQHPTQALLDLYTIEREIGRLNNIYIAMVGDLKNGRTIRSLAYLLGKYTGIHIILVSPKELKIGADIKAYLKRHDVSFEETVDLETALPKVDVVYQTRIQKERFKSLREYNKHKGCYVISLAQVAAMKPKSIIMHPLPRVGEILQEVDASPKAVYFKQAKYGLLVRMALLKAVLGK